jgi:transposase
MAYIAGPDRSQAVLLPEVLDDYVRPDNPVRFLDAFVAQLELGALGFQRAVPAAPGRPGYDPGDLLRLYLYGYLHRIRSSRRLEQETHRNVELMWLLRRLTPDCKTIADFRRDHPEALQRWAGRSCCCAGSWSCLGASCWLSTGASSAR